MERFLISILDLFVGILWKDPIINPHKIRRKSIFNQYLTTVQATNYSKRNLLGILCAPWLWSYEQKILTNDS